MDSPLVLKKIITGAAPCPWSRYVPAMRPEILFPLYAPIASLKGVGARVAPHADGLHEIGFAPIRPLPGM